MKKLFGLMLLFSTVLVFETRAATEQLSASQILDNAIVAMGGKLNLEGIHTRIVVANIKVKGLSGTFQSWAKAPDSYKTMLDLGVVKREQAFDGSKGWQKDTSLHELTGPDLARVQRSAVFDPVLQNVQAHTQAELKGMEKVNGSDAYIIEFHPPKGTPERFYFDVQTFFLVREVRQVPYEKGPQELTISYGDYRKIGQTMLPFSITQEIPGQTIVLQVQDYQINTPIENSVFENPGAKYAKEPYDITISTIPHHVYKEDNGVWEPGRTESWVFSILVNEKYGRQVDPVSAVIDFYSGEVRVKSAQLQKPVLDAIRGNSFAGLAAQEEAFDLRHEFSEPVALHIDRIAYRMELVTPQGNKVEKTLEIPLTSYETKTKLIFPLRGKFMVGGGHDTNEPHKEEWSQHYAYDIIGLGDNYEFVKNDAKENADFFMWGREIIAPADGVVVFSRNDVPDNPKPGKVDTDLFMSLPDPRNGVGGNNVIIDHGNGEFSLLGHLQQGSVKVKVGDQVKQGDVLGLLGNSGNSDGPHLHYHLMACERIFQCDGLPSKFINIVINSYVEQSIQIMQPKRGIYLEAMEPKK